MAGSTDVDERLNRLLPFGKWHKQLCSNKALSKLLWAQLVTARAELVKTFLVCLAHTSICSWFTDDHLRYYVDKAENLYEQGKAYSERIIWKKTIVSFVCLDCTIDVGEIVEVMRYEIKPEWNFIIIKRSVIIHACHGLFRIENVLQGSNSLTKVSHSRLNGKERIWALKRVLLELYNSSEI